METDGFEPGFEWRDALVEDADGGDAGFAECGAKARGGVGDHGLAALLEEWEVGHCVADVGEVVAEAGLERGEFVFSGEVELAVGGEDAGEEAEMVGDAVGGVGVGGGGEVDGAAGGALLLKILKEFTVVGEMGDVELDRICQVTFEGGFALDEPAGDLQERSRVVASEGKRRVVEGVRLDEGAVEVDAEHREGGGMSIAGAGMGKSVLPYV